jgi:hypothetical protein
MQEAIIPTENFELRNPYIDSGSAEQKLRKAIPIYY